MLEEVTFQRFDDWFIHDGIRIEQQHERRGRGARREIHARREPDVPIRRDELRARMTATKFIDSRDVALLIDDHELIARPKKPLDRRQRATELFIDAIVDDEYCDRQRGRLYSCAMVIASWRNAR